MDNKEFEYKLYFDGEFWIMEQYNKTDEFCIFAVMGVSEMDCFKQMFDQEEIINKEFLFKFHWLDGKTDEGYGLTVADAFTKLGYGNGAMGALDYYEELK
jgi:hypothetical protein